ncbi:hypothetical protein G6F65_018267 [Rhizopus arrhizus]|nr:hypothetical protein G6F65_018267 [Rhizopus arrhizus]
MAQQRFHAPAPATGQLFRKAAPGRHRVALRRHRHHSAHRHHVVSRGPAGWHCHGDHAGADVPVQPTAGVDRRGRHDAVRLGALVGLCVAALCHRRAHHPCCERAVALSGNGARGQGHQAVPASERPAFALAGVAGQRNQRGSARAEMGAVLSDLQRPAVRAVVDRDSVAGGAAGAGRPVHRGRLAGIHRL